MAERLSISLHRDDERNGQYYAVFVTADKFRGPDGPTQRHYRVSRHGTVRWVTALGVPLPPSLQAAADFMYCLDVK